MLVAVNFSINDVSISQDQENVAFNAFKTALVPFNTIADPVERIVNELKTQTYLKLKSSFWGEGPTSLGRWGIQF